MNIPESDQDFLRDLVKLSRQRSHHVRWVDRDGTERITTLTAADGARVAALAQQLRVSKADLFRQAAHLPVKRPAAEP